MIETTIAPHDANEAFELLWSFLQLAPSIHERTDDSNGAVGGVMSDAVDLIAEISPRISKDHITLAERVLDAVADAGYGEFDGIIPATAEALGQDGLEHLKRITQTWAGAPPTEQELEQSPGLRPHVVCRKTARDATSRRRGRSSWRMSRTPKGMSTPTWPAIPKNS